MMVAKFRRTHHTKICRHLCLNQPDHKCTIFHWVEQIKLLKDYDANMPSKMSDFLVILKTFIEPAKSNYGKDSKAYRCTIRRSKSKLIFQIDKYSIVSNNLIILIDK